MSERARHDEVGDHIALARGEEVVLARTDEFAVDPLVHADTERGKRSDDVDAAVRAEAERLNLWVRTLRRRLELFSLSMLDRRDSSLRTRRSKSLSNWTARPSGPHISEYFSTMLGEECVAAMVVATPELALATTQTNIYTTHSGSARGESAARVSRTSYDRSTGPPGACLRVWVHTLNIVEMWEGGLAPG